MTTIITNFTQRKKRGMRSQIWCEDSTRHSVTASFTDETAQIWIEEEAEAREAHFKDLLEREEPSNMKAGIENDVPQRQTEWELNDPITQEEITKAIAKLKPTGPGFSGAHAACFKAIWAEGGEAAGLLNPGRWIVPQGNTAAVAEVRRAAWDV